MGKFFLFAVVVAGICISPAGNQAISAIPGFFKLERVRSDLNGDNHYFWIYNACGTKFCDFEYSEDGRFIRARW